MDDPSLPEIARLTIAVESGVLKSGLSSAKIWVTKTVSSEMLPVPLSVIAMAVGLPPNLHGPRGPG